MTKRRIDQSQLDWLWETYGDKSIGGNPGDVGGDGFLTKDGVAQLIADQTQRLLASLELEDETDAGKLPVYVVRANGKREKVFELDPEDHLIKISRRESTQVDIDNGYAEHIGKPFVDFEMLSGKKLGLSLEGLILTGSKTKTIETLVQSGVIYSELVIAPNNDTAVTCTDSQNGLYVTLRLSQKHGQVELLKNENGLVVEFKWADGSDVQMREMNWVKYSVDEGNRKGVIYFVKDKKFIVLNGVRYGEIPSTVVQLTILNEETGESALVLPEKSALMQKKGDKMINLTKVNEAGSIVTGQSDVPYNIFGSTDHLSYNGTSLSTVSELDTEKKRVDNMINQLNENVNDSIKQINTFITNSVNTINGAINDEIRPSIDNLKTVTSDLNTAFTNYKATNDRAIQVIHDTINTVNTNAANGIAQLKTAWENSVNTINGAINNELRPAIQKLQETDVIINNNLVSSINTINTAINNAVNTINGAIENEIRPAIKSIQEEVEKAVKWDDVATEDNPNRKAITLKNHDTLLGTDTNGTTFNLAMLSKWNVADYGSVSVPINLNGSKERPTYNDDEEIALMKDIDAIKLPVEFSFPLRTLQDKVYSQEEIFGWFGVTNAVELKGLITREGQFYLRYGIQLSGNPYYYKMPIQYVAFESANQLKMVVIGLDTKNDMPVKYEIVINLDGTIIEGNSNIKVVSSNLAFTSDIPSLDTYATKDEVALKANQSDVDFQVDALNEKIDAIVVPTKVSELENDSTYQTASDVDNRINQIIGAAPEALDTLEEIANKLSDNDDAVAAITTQIAEKASVTDLAKETEARSLADTNLQNDLQSEAETRASKDAELEELLSKKIEWINVATEDNPGRKSIVLANHDTILGYTTNGAAVNIAMVSKWDKVDMGSTQLPFNMNGSEERPTYNDDKQLALKDDVDAMYSKADMFGDIDPTIFAGGYTMQVLSKLEQSYIDDLGNPANVDGKPYDASSNPYLLGQPYLVVGSIENIFSYDLYGLNTYNMGMVGQIAKIMKVSLDGYDIKMSNIEKRLSALEQQGN